MLKLNLKTEPYWITLPEQVKVKVKPITTALMSAAQAMAAQAYQALAATGTIEQASESMRKGVSESLLVKALAQISILEWEGIKLAESDDPAPVNDATISQLMDYWLIAQKFLEKYVTQITRLEMEGNVLAPAATGTSAAVALTAPSAD